LWTLLLKFFPLQLQGVEYVAGENAPLVFFSGFTRSFLQGEQGTSAQWLQKKLGSAWFMIQHDPTWIRVCCLSAPFPRIPDVWLISSVFLVFKKSYSK